MSIVRCPTRWSRAVALPLLILGSGCGGEEEPPTEEELLAERLGRLVEAQEGEHAPITEQELRTWEAAIRNYREESDPEVYANFRSCMEGATTFAIAEECFLIVDPQDSEEELPPPQSVDDICSLWDALYARETIDGRSRVERDHCARSLATLKSPMEADAWRQFGECAEQAESPEEFDTCRIDAMPSITDHCNSMETSQSRYGEEVPANYAETCAERLNEKLENTSLHFRAELACCLDIADNPLQIDRCLTATVPTCPVD